MLALSLERKRSLEQLRLVRSLSRDYVRYIRLATCYCPRLIERNYLHLARLLQRERSLKQYAVLCTHAVTNHYRHGCGEPERARTAYYEHRYSPRECVTEALSHEHPDYSGHNSNAYHNGHENTRNLVRDLCYGGFCRRGVAHHADYLRKRRVLPDSRCPTAYKARKIDRRRTHCAARRLVCGYALARKRGFVYRALSLDYYAIDRNILTRTHHENVSSPYLLNGYEYLCAASLDRCGLGRKLHKSSERIGGLALTARFEHLANRNERDNHSRGLKVKLVHTVHNGGMVACKLSRGHRKERVCAVRKRRPCTQSHERIHIWCAAEQAFYAVYEEFLIDYEYCCSQQELNEPHSYVIVRKESGQRPAPHRVTH